MSINRLPAEECCGCYACASLCTKKCISMVCDKDGFWYPQVDTSLCVDCGMCEKACPVLINSTEAANERIPRGYAAINLDEAVRNESSSGGIFTLLAEKVLSDGGVVFGAALSGDCREVYHTAVEHPIDLCRLRGSKYVQSRIGETYKQAQNALVAGRKVLFTGTPCQIEGLKAFLRRDYDGLICADIICHGVPSPKVWRKYIDFRESQAGASIQQTFFRHKKYGWKTFAIMFKFANAPAYIESLSTDMYMQAFLRDICLRPSCYQCRFKKLCRESDITLADFWGIENIMPEMDDDRGTSLLMIHSEKGARIFNSLATKMNFKEIDVQSALLFNTAATKSAQANPNRGAYFNALDKVRFDQLTKKYVMSRSLKANLVSVLKRVGLYKIIQYLRKKGRP